MRPPKGTPTALNLEVAAGVAAMGGDIEAYAKSKDWTAQNVIVHIERTSFEYYAGPSKKRRGRPHRFTLWRERGVPARIVDEQAEYELYLAMSRMREVAKATHKVIGAKYNLSLERVRQTLILGPTLWSQPPIVRWFNEKSDLARLATMKMPECTTEL